MEHGERLRVHLKARYNAYIPMKRFSICHTKPQKDKIGVERFGFSSFTYFSRVFDISNTAAANPVVIMF